MASARTVVSGGVANGQRNVVVGHQRNIFRHAQAGLVIPYAKIIFKAP